MQQSGHRVSWKQAMETAHSYLLRMFPIAIVHTCEKAPLGSILVIRGCLHGISPQKTNCLAIVGLGVASGEFIEIDSFGVLEGRLALEQLLDGISARYHVDWIVELASGGDLHSLCIESVDMKVCSCRRRLG